MLKLFSVLLFVCICGSSYAQTDSRPPYLQFPQVPPFKVLLVPDSTTYMKKDIAKNKPFILFYFSPDCDHCIKATEELLSQPDLLNKVQILMVSVYDSKTLLKFYKEFSLEKYKSIHLGRDASNFFSSFYLNKTFPAIYAYKKNGKLKGELVPDSSIAAFIKKL